LNDSDPEIGSPDASNSQNASIFAGLAKARGRQNIYYWRIKDKKEIDFIVKDKNAALPI